MNIERLELCTMKEKFCSESQEQIGQRSQNSMELCYLITIYGLEWTDG